MEHEDRPRREGEESTADELLDTLSTLGGVRDRRHQPRSDHADQRVHGARAREQ
jgi:hypothetical protein